VYLNEISPQGVLQLSVIQSVEEYGQTTSMKSHEDNDDDYLSSKSNLKEPLLL
jgi:hypothetical protein